MNLINGPVIGCKQQAHVLLHMTVASNNQTGTLLIKHPILFQTAVIKIREGGSKKKREREEGRRNNASVQKRSGRESHSVSTVRRCRIYSTVTVPTTFYIHTHF